MNTDRDKLMNDINNPLGRTIRGQVISVKMNKTITVLVERKVKHPLYGKVVRKSTKYHAHDEHNTSVQGNTVIIEQCRPFSKTKSWKLIKIEE